MTTKPTVLVATADPVEVNRWIVQGKVAGISVQIMNDTHETFASAQRELESIHTRVHKLNADLGFLTEKISMMCLRLVEALGQEKSLGVPTEPTRTPETGAEGQEGDP